MGTEPCSKGNPSSASGKADDIFCEVVKPYLKRSRRWTRQTVVVFRIRTIRQYQTGTYSKRCVTEKDRGAPR